MDTPEISDRACELGVLETIPASDLTNIALLRYDMQKVWDFRYQSYQMERAGSQYAVMLSQIYNVFYAGHCQ